MFIPLWILDTGMLLAACMLYILSCCDSDREDRPKEFFGGMRRVIYAPLTRVRNLFAPFFCSLRAHCGPSCGATRANSLVDK